MGTLIQQPDREAAQVSGLQPIVRPDNKSGGLGTFLTNILPAVNQELETYDENSKDRVIALGRNDQLNNVLHEVSFLDRRNYKAGRTYQNMVNGQIALATEFQDVINSTADADFDPDELLKKGREFTDKSVANIHDSDLPSELKKQLYDSQLKENSTYMTMVDKKIKRLRADSAATTRINSQAALTKDLNNEDFGVEELAVRLGAFIEKSKLTAITGNPDMTEAEAHEQAVADIKGAMTYSLDQLKAADIPNVVERIDYLNEVAESLIDYDVGLASTVQTKAAEVRREVQTAQTAKENFLVNNWLRDRRDNPSMWSDTDATKGKLLSIQANTAIPYEDGLGMMTKILDENSAYNNKVLEADVIIDPRTESLWQYKARGQSEDKRVADIIGAFITDYPSDPALGALKALDFFRNDSEYSAVGTKEAAALVFTNITGYAKMSDSEVNNDKFAGQRGEQFAILKSMYLQYRDENTSKARDLMSGIPDEYVDAFTTAFLNNGSLEDVRRDFQNPITRENLYKNIEAAVADKEGLAKSLKLGNEVLFGGDGGTLTKSMSDGAEAAYVAKVSESMSNSKPYLVGAGKVRTTDAALQLFSKNGGLMKSRKGYSSIIMDLNVATQVKGWKVSGTNTPLNEAYFTDAADVYRETLAKKYGTNSSNVMVSSDATGQNLHFELLKSSGWFGKGAASTETEVTITMARIKQEAEKAYAEDSTRRNSPSGQSQRQSNTTVGRATIAQHRSSKTHDVKVSADYAYAFGGDLVLGTEWVNHMGRYEKYVAQLTNTKDANSKKGSQVWAMGITYKTAHDFDKATGSRWVQRLRAAEGNAQESINIQGQFARVYYKDLPSWTKEVGIPAPNANGNYSPRHKPALMLLVDAKWHGGQHYQGMNKVLNARNYKEARGIMQGLSIFNRAKIDSERNKWMEYNLQQYFSRR